MKVFHISVVILIVICVLIGSHSYVMNKMGGSIAEKSQKIQVLAQNEEWSEVSRMLEETEAEWEKYSPWAALTISTDEIEQLEISLAQAKAFAGLGQKANFFGEFVMFSKLVEHIPHREGFHIEEIL